MALSFAAEPRGAGPVGVVRRWAWVVLVVRSVICGLLTLRHKLCTAKLALLCEAKSRDRLPRVFSGEGSGDWSLDCRLCPADPKRRCCQE
ncbi:hypothetical protein GCM10009810_13380 [Nostocoides vanveenii]|uniref:Secreted protein n=1 Tax=Nostocoides vanveenii TaxID=330835 RepID=A0ABN2KFP2_9MICO